MRFYIFFIVLFNLMTSLKSNSAYIITNDNDTIYGKIAEQQMFEYINFVKFKANDSLSENTFFPGQIKGFRLSDGKFFVSQKITLNNTEKLVFLEWLIKGKANIFEYYTPESNTFFLLTDNGEFVELKNTLEKIHGINFYDYAMYDFEKKEYVGILKYYFKDAKPLTENINHLDYNRNSMINIAKKYHNYVCPNEDCEIFSAPKWKPKNSIGAIFGINFPSIISNTQKDIITVQNSSVLGLYYNISHIPYAKNFEVQFEVYWLKQNFEILKKYYNHGDNAYPLVKFNVNELCFPVFLKYVITIPKTNLSIFPGIGIGYRSVKVDKSKEDNDNTMPLKNQYLKYNEGEVALSTGIYYAISKHLSIDISFKYEIFSTYGKSILETYETITPGNSNYSDRIVTLGLRYIL